MDNDLSFLINKSVEKAEMVHDYLQLFFADSGVLNIYNACKVSDELSKINNRRLTEIERVDDTLIIRLADNFTISIDMSDSGYTGPEAIEYCKNNKILIIN